MTVKVELCTLNKILDGIAKIVFLGSLTKETERSFVKDEYGVDLFKVHQTHSSDVVLFDDNTDLYGYFEGDAIVSQVSGVMLGIVTADCVPVVFVDIKNHTVAIAHVGWRGARAKIIENTINAMLKFGNEADIVAALGPGIHPEHYVVKSDFIDNFMSETDKNSVYFSSKGSDIVFDLPSYIKDKIRKNKIDNVYDVEIDTYSCRSFSSLRRDKTTMPYSNLSLVMLDCFADRSDHKNFARIIQQTKNIEIMKNNKSFSSSQESDGFYYNNLHVRESVSSSLPDYFSSSLSEGDNVAIVKNIQSGKVTINAKLDLHGYTIDDAFLKLKDFVIDNFDNSSRYLLVITGKGRDGGSVIRSSMLSWVENNDILKRYILTCIEALPKDGGSGAFYLILRKNSN